MRTVYMGERRHGRTSVVADGLPLCPRTDLVPIRCTGYDWGIHSAGSRLLALSILAFHCPSDENKALAAFEKFTELICAFPRRRWSLESNEIDRFLRGIVPSARNRTNVKT